MNYAKMSDFEINRKVLAITSGAKPLGYAHDADKRSAGIVKSNVYGWYDYCNSWADAGPIIEKGLISLQFCQGNWMASVNPSQETGFRAACFIEKRNPLRAAMIVFLMMQENKDE